ncbi:MAG: SafA/ExsA family spore coat assembly protein [Acutalibacteraceae bacterium]
MKIFKKLTVFFACFALILCGFSASAQSGSYTVQKGDSLWKISVKYEIGLSELTDANPQINDPSLIYVGQVINIPNIDSIKELEMQVIELINRQRSANGLQTLSYNRELCRAARYKSQDMIDKGYFAHQSPTYGSPFTMMQNFGLKFSAAGENIAYGQETPESVMNDWMNSPGHRANILSAVYNQVGVGAAKASNGTCYWTLMLIKTIN